ncbi:secretory carrier-associated membrane protein 1 [Histomonas meleagridis]|uniref:secretory carrier-associated membrane protein 1 n=1 Tax=Histomonas meleagridis TaxID=135588 RepID=UPI00355A5A95|nr:secretory carrier-associated membrane protein 1 [Histomonas meleagridis]KAH0797275.1 secretory carrier-associated membrane protein 1 [Histomonas meleagridis]
MENDIIPPDNHEPSETSTQENSQHSIESDNSYQEPTTENNSQLSNASARNNDLQFVDPITGIPISEEDLSNREAELARREQEIEKLEQQLRDGTISSRPKNIPPFFPLWSYYPDDDLPSSKVKIAKQIFIIYCICGVVYLINLIGAISCFDSDTSKHTTSPATKLVLSIIYLFVFVPLSFECSYFVLYDSLISGKGLRFFWFMVTYFIWFAVLVINLIGLDGGGSVGFIQMVNLFGSKTKAAAIFGLFFCLLGIAEAAGMVYTFIKLIKIYKSEGLMGKALDDASTLAMQMKIDSGSPVSQEEYVVGSQTYEPMN